MPLLAQLARLGRWRWATTIVLVGAACVPVLAATWLIPNEIAAPWDGGSRTSRSRSDSELASPKVGQRPKRTPRTPSAQVPEPSTESAPAGDVAPGAPAPGPGTKSVHGYFVPSGETDDSAPIVPSREAVQ